MSRELCRHCRRKGRDEGQRKKRKVFGDMKYEPAPEGFGYLSLLTRETFDRYIEAHPERLRGGS